MKLVGESKTREVRILNSEFKKLWEKESIDIREVPLSKYRSKERKQIDSPGFIIGKEIKALLNFVKTKQAIRHVKPEKGACYLDVISSYMTKETEKTIYQKRSNWEKQKYTFMCSSKKTDFTRWKNSKYILQYEIIGKRKRIGLFEIMDHTEFSTKDGKYFVALKRMSNTGVKQLDAVSTKNFLKSIRLKSTKDQKAKKLTRAQTEEIFDYFIKHK